MARNFNQTRQEERRHRFKFRWVVLACLVAVVFLVLQLAARGFPARWERIISEKLSTPDFIVKLEHINFQVTRGLGVRRILIIPRVNPQTPLIRIDDASVKFSVRPGEPLSSWIHSVTVYRVEMPELPHISAVDEAPPLELPVLGPLQFQCDIAEILGLSGRQAKALITSDGRRLRLAGCSVDVAPPHALSEEVRGDFIFEFSPVRLEGRASGHVNPARLIPHFHVLGLPYTADLIGCFTVSADPVAVGMQWEYAPVERRRRLVLDVDAATGVRFLTVSFMSVQGRLLVEGADHWRWLRVRNLQTMRPEGELSGNLTFDLDEGWMELDGVSTIDPLLLPGLADMPLKLQPGTLRFAQGSRVTAKGTLALSHDVTRQTAIHGTIETPTLWIQKIRMDDVTAGVGISDTHITVERFAGQCYEGTVGALGAVSLTGDVPMLDLSLRLNHVNVGPFIEAIQRDSMLASAPGWFNVSLEIAGPLSTNALSTLTGRGILKMREAQLFRFPLFAGLTDFLGRNVPGVDFILSQNNLNATYRIDDGGIQFSELTIEGNIFSIIANGNYWFDDGLDFGVRVGLLRQRTFLGRILRVVLFPVSKLFELEVTGSLDNPSWSPTTLTLRRRRERTRDGTGEFAPATIETAE